MHCFLAGALLVLLPVPPLPGRAQSAPPAVPAEKTHDEFFSGVITVMAYDKVTVFKTVLGKDSETHVFLITKDTRVEGKLRVKARVTVRYAHADDGDLALHIIVRTSQKK